MEAAPFCISIIMDRNAISLEPNQEKTWPNLVIFACGTGEEWYLNGV